MTDTLNAIIAELRAGTLLLANRADDHDLADRLEKLRGDAWQPIATAPQNSVDVLVNLNNGQGATLIARTPGTGQWWSGWEKIPTPTHWQPLPAPPQSGADPDPIVHPWDAVGTRNQPEPPLPG